MKKQPTRLQAVAETRRLNRRFKNATPAQRRVMIATDALKQIASGKYKATAGVWNEVDDIRGKDVDYYAPLQPLLQKPTITCECCGVGALFLSYVRINNAASAVEGGGVTEIQSIIDWPTENLRLIESTFERRASCEAPDFCDARPDDTKLLTAILENIIANRGTFRPHKPCKR